MERRRGMMSEQMNLVDSTSHSYSLIESAIESFNSEEGYLKGYDCPICRNKGIVAVLQNGKDLYKQCRCMKIRNIENLQRNSGIDRLLDRYTFERYQVKANWQDKTLKMAIKFAEEKAGWFFISGKPGSGKTHICTAIVNEFLKEGIPSRYMLWKDDGTKIKAAINSEGYTSLIQPMKEAACLYIDDFLKGNVTQGDLNLAYEIINHRYNANFLTLISSEKSILEILKMDEALGSRIYERTKKGENLIDLKNVFNCRLIGGE